MSLNQCSVLAIPGCGNIASICRSFQHIGLSTHLLTTSSKSIPTQLLILPGVGSFENAMHSLSSSCLLDLVNNHLSLGLPTIGICLGYQILCQSFVETTSSDISPISGLSMFDSIAMTDLTSLPAKMNVGPRPIFSCRNEHSFSGMFYFMHRYGYVLPDDSTHVPSCVHSYCYHANHRIAAICQKDNIWGIQFHPEKSGSAGLSILNSIVQGF